ncbi:MAG: hypothetical protein QM747_00450 [Nocardioides sp.]
MVEEVQRFRTTNGKVTGVLGLVVCAAVAVAIVVSEPPHVAVAGVLACAFAAVLVWLALLRPSVSATESELRMRTLVETISIPMASIEAVAVRRYLLVRSGGRRYICPAISRSLRKSVKAEMKYKPNQLLGASSVLDRIEPDAGSGFGSARPGKKGGVGLVAGQDQDLAYGDFVEQRIAHLAASDRARRGIEERSEEEYALGSQVVRRTAWPELALLAVLAVAFVVVVVAG